MGREAARNLMVVNFGPAIPVGSVAPGIVNLHTNFRMRWMHKVDSWRPGILMNEGKRFMKNIVQQHKGAPKSCGAGVAMPCYNKDLGGCHVHRVFWHMCDVMRSDDKPKLKRRMACGATQRTPGAGGRAKKYRLRLCDTRFSYDLTSEKTLPKCLAGDIPTSPNPTILNTANGETDADREVDMQKAFMENIIPYVLGHTGCHVNWQTV